MYIITLCQVYGWLLSMEFNDLHLQTISEKQQSMEDSRRITPDLWYTLVENHPSPILVCVDGLIVYTNRAGAQILGYSSPESLIDRSLFEHMSMEEGDTLKKLLIQASGDGPVSLPSLKLIQIDGHEVIVAWSAVTTSSEGKKAEQIFLKDISHEKQLEDQLHEREGSYRLLAENASDVIMRHKLDGTCIYISPTCRRQSGFEPEEFIGKSAFSYVHPEDLGKVMAALVEVLQIKDVVSTFRIRHKQGGYVWVESTGRTALDPVTGKPTEIITVTRDISKRMQAIQQLRISEELTSGILAASLDGIIALEAIRNSQGQIEDFRYLLVNPMAGRMLHRPDTSMEGKSLLQELPIFRNMGLFDRYVQVVETGDPYYGEFLFSDDFTAWFHVTVVRRGDGLAITLRDISDRKRYEEALRSSELKYRALLEQAGDAIFLADAETGMLLDANCRAQELIGYSLEEIRKMHQTDLHPKHEVERYEDQFFSHKEENPILVTDNIIVHRDGELIPVDISASVIDIEGKRLVLGIFRDITERYRAEEQIRRTLQRERELGELKSRFISMASHELRTPLATILSSTFLLDQFGERWKRDMIDKHLQRIRSNVNQMIELLEDVLVVGRAEEGLLSFHPTRIDVLEFIRNLVDEFRMGVGARHALTVNARAKSYFVEIDEKLFRMVVENLLSNACKYSEPGTKITIGVSRKDLNLVISIRDEGIGIRSEDIPFLFEPFHRGSNVGSARGTGLGLTLVSRAVERHSGRILIDSKEGKGTVVSVQLPLVQS